MDKGAVMDTFICGAVIGAFLFFAGRVILEVRSKIKERNRHLETAEREKRIIEIAQTEIDYALGAYSGSALLTGEAPVTTYEARTALAELVCTKVEARRKLTAKIQAQSQKSYSRALSAVSGTLRMPKQGKR